MNPIVKPTVVPYYTHPSEEFVVGAAKIIQFKTNEICVYSYIIFSGKQAVLVDPVFDVQSYVEALKDHTLTHIILTHHHSDYITGHMEFGKTPIVMGPHAKRPGLAFHLETTEALKVGSVQLQALHTPGHTLESTSFILLDGDSKQLAVFTGDALFIGDVGKPDIASPSEASKEQLAEMLYDTVTKFKEMSPSCIVLPGHFAGSTYGRKATVDSSSSIETQIKNNPYFQPQGKPEFVKKVIDETPHPPFHYFTIASLNLFGHKSFSEATNIPAIDTQKWKELTKTQCTVIDTRSNNEELKKGYIKGAYLMPEAGLLISWLGHMFDTKNEILLFADKDRREELATRVARAGYTIAAFNDFSVEEWEAQGGAVTRPLFSTIDTMKKTPNAYILDSRNQEEALKERVEGSHNIPYFLIDKNITKIEKGRPIFVHCRIGMRARIASSVLARHGIECFILPIKFEEFAEAGVPIIKDQPL